MPKQKTIVWSSQSYGTGLAGSFTANGGSVRVFFAGSAYSRSASATLAVNLVIDNNVQMTLNGYTNEANSHKSLVPAIAELSLGSGSHNVSLSTSGSTVIDLNDYFTLEVSSK